jgi:23S rRNA (guanine745-N1)-methyltransferase
MSSPLACTVRGCGHRLHRQERTLVCDAGHTFDVSRTGYINLLQPQDRRSREAGDVAAAVDARQSLLAAGFGVALIEHVTSVAASLSSGSVVADLGCGTGEALGTMVDRHAVCGVGIDLSVRAIARAARRWTSATWVVANADRRLPLLDESVSLVMSLHARRNPVESARVLADEGRLLVAVPAADDLQELREAITGEALERDRSHAVETEHATLFRLIARDTIREQHRVGRDVLLQLLQATYRGERQSGRAAPVAAGDLSRRTS